MKRFLLTLLLVSCTTEKGMQGYFYIKTENANLRKSPSTKSKVVEILKKDTIVYPISSIPYNLFEPGDYTNSLLYGQWIKVIVSNTQSKGWIFSPYLGYKFLNITNGFIFDMGLRKNNEHKALLFHIGRLKKGILYDTTTNDLKTLRKIFKAKKTNSIYLYYLSGKVETNKLINPKIRTGYNIFETWPGNEMIEIEIDLINKPIITNLSWKTFMGKFQFGNINVISKVLSNDYKFKDFIISNIIENFTNSTSDVTNVLCITKKALFISSVINKKKEVIFSNIPIEYYKLFDNKTYINTFSVYIKEKNELKNIYMDFSLSANDMSEFELFYMITDLNNDKVPEIWTKVYCYESSYYKIYIFYNDLLIHIANIGWVGV
ncbi:MAG: SH3 domain-containing protein [Brevinematales bacterium]|nr:SH3 domain-containing protein [Brevinematales bacterium]